jgi:hypothetical protein
MQAARRAACRRVVALTLPPVYRDSNPGQVRVPPSSPPREPPTHQEGLGRVPSSRVGTESPRRGSRARHGALAPLLSLPSPSSKSAQNAEDRAGGGQAAQLPSAPDPTLDRESEA